MNVALFANHFVEAVVVNSDGNPMIDPVRKRLTDIAPPLNDSDAANKEYIDGVSRAIISNKNYMGGEKLTNLGMPTNAHDAVAKEYVDDGIPGRLRRIKNIEELTDPTDVSTKSYSTKFMQ